MFYRDPLKEGYVTFLALPVFELYGVLERLVKVLMI